MAQSILSIRSVEAFYGQFQALFGIELTVFPGEIVSIIGANGAGKSTLMKSIIGHETAVKGDIFFDGSPIIGLGTRDIIERGIAHVPEGRRLFSSLTVEENLRIGLRGGSGMKERIDEVYSLFPVLAQRRKSYANQLSGGQQQMVAIGRALLSNPRLLLCDEISIGLAPVVIEEIYELIPKISARGIAIVIVEQDIRRSLQVSSRFYCMLHGRISLAGSSNEYSSERIAPYYLGAAK